MIKLFPIESLQYTVFEETACLALLRKNKIEMSPDIEQADIYLLRSLNIDGIRLFQRYMAINNIKPKPILVWTHEPRYAPTDCDCIEIEDFCTIYIMNLYTHNVYFSNYTFFGKTIDRQLQPISTISFSKRPIVGLASYIQPQSREFILNGIDIDLSLKRQNLLLQGYHTGCLDIYGKDWPDLVAVSESRGSGWQNAKTKLLENYQFNIALENTSYDYYCSEKIWDSIKGYCLPIYSSFNNKICDTFPKNSFIDFDDFPNNDALLDYILAMPMREYVTRLNRCIEVYNYLHDNINFEEERQLAYCALMDKIKKIWHIHSS